MAERKRTLEAAGWGFWTAMFVLCLGPSIYGVFQIGDEGVNPIVLVTFGTMGAGVVAGILSWVANLLLQTRAAKIHVARERTRKQHRKHK